jgi:7-cyano-7-deazaguanine synthase
MIHENEKTDRTLVLLSGGLDSTAALLWARRRGGEVHAVFIYYGQPSATRECERAIAATRALGVPFNRLDVASAFYGGSSQGLFTPRPSGTEHGVDTAFVPVRNPVLLSAAAARALMLWPGEPVGLCVGFNANDAAGFPDCRPAFIEAFETAINLGLGGALITVLAPWAQSSKRDVVTWVRENAAERMPLIEASWSCYRERGPCGECTACVTRAAAMS